GTPWTPPSPPTSSSGSSPPTAAASAATASPSSGTARRSTATTAPGGRRRPPPRRRCWTASAPPVAGGAALSRRRCPVPARCRSPCRERSTPGSPSSTGSAAAPSPPWPNGPSPTPPGAFPSPPPARPGSPPAGPGWGDWDAVYGGAGPGVRLRQPDLARTLKTVAAEGPDAFYRGAVGAEAAAHVRRIGGLLDRSDLAAHRGEWVEPLEGRYRDLTVAELPPNSQGSAALLALHVLDRAGPLPPDGPERQHRLIEAVATALAERDAHLTDPAHMRLPPAVLA